MTRVYDHDGAAVKAGFRTKPPETEQEPSLQATYPIGPSSTIDPARLGPTYPGQPAAERPVVLPIRHLYLGMRSGRHNAALFTIGRDWNRRK
jgi:hypothetical protein